MNYQNDRNDGLYPKFNREEGNYMNESTALRNKH